jgi:hypothetical protein
MEELDVTVARDEAIGLARENMNFLAAVAAPEVFQFMFPPIFLAIWQLITKAAMEAKGQIKLAIGLPRGFAKTFVMKLICLWIILFTNRRFILIVCNTEPHAQNFIADVTDLLSNSSIIRIFGDWRLSKEMDQQLKKKFFFRGRDVILAGLGKGGSPRGLNIKYVRPDVILMDDMQSREDAKSPVQSQHDLEWFMGTLLKANDKLRCLFVYVGNMYPYEGTILKKLKENPVWTTFITGAILEDGNSIWPELRSVEDILQELDDDEAMGCPEIFYSEVMNDDVAGTRAGVDIGRINCWKPDPAKPIFAHAGFVIIDPSAGKKKSDDVAIGAIHVYDEEPVLTELLTGKFSPGDQCREAIRLCMKHGFAAIVVEDVAYQATLIYWMEQVLQQLQIRGIKILPINPNGLSKTYRILEMLKQLTATKHGSRIHIAPEVRSTVVHQVTYFDPSKTNNKDDILDILAYSKQVVHQYRFEISIVMDMLDDFPKATFSEDLQLEF